MQRNLLRFLLLAVLAGLSSVTPVFASFHFMVIEEVFPGTPVSPAAQYVMLRFTFSGQNLVAGTVIEVQDSDGTLLGLFGTFPSNVGVAGGICTYPNCPALIIGTAAAQTLLGMTFDVVVDAQVGRVPLPISGGRVCFYQPDSLGSVVDCVAYTTYTAPNTVVTPTQNGCDDDFGPPAAGLQLGLALDRGISNCPEKNNATDFALRFPRPVANNGTNALADADADTLIDRLDCAGNDATSLYPVMEVATLDLEAGAPPFLTWPSQSAMGGTSTRYDIVSGDVAGLRPAGGFSGAVCFAGALSATSLGIPAVPPLGTGVFFLVRARSGCGKATYGNSGQAPDPRDFLDDPLNDPCF